MQIEKTKLFGLPVEAHSDISKIGGGKKEKSDHLCIAEVSQITVAQFAREQVYQKHSCPKSKDLVDNKNNFAKRKKSFASEMHYDSNNGFLAILWQQLHLCLQLEMLGLKFQTLKLSKTAIGKKKKSQFLFYSFPEDVS